MPQACTRTLSPGHHTCSMGLALVLPASQVRKLELCKDMWLTSGRVGGETQVGTQQPCAVFLLEKCNFRAQNIEHLEACFPKFPDTEVRGITGSTSPPSPWRPQGMPRQVTPIQWPPLFTSKSIDDWTVPGIGPRPGTSQCFINASW